MQVRLDERNDKEVQSVRISDNVMFGKTVLEVGVNGVKKILYHEPVCDGDRHFVDVITNDDIITRFFDVVSIIFM